MIQTDGAGCADLEPGFWGHKWTENTISEYRQGICKLISLRGRKVMFHERHFAAALMHLYFGTFSRAEIAEIASTTPAEVALLRTQIDFMMLVDAAKFTFAKDFRENLMLNEYPPLAYVSIAAEHVTLDELLRHQIRVPLITRLKEHAKSISERDHSGLAIDTYDLRAFKKLFSFFFLRRLLCGA
jgi:hypothetical protein